MTRFFEGLTVCALAGLLACNRGKGGDTMNFRHNKDHKGTPVATFNDDSVTLEELKQRFSEMSPFLRARYQTVEQRKDYVDGLARFELLAAEAHRRGLQNDPEVVETAKKVMVQKLIQKEFDEKQGTVPDNEIKDYYEAHKSDYVKPELIRLSEIFFAAPKEDAAARKKKKAQAEEVLAKAKSQNALDSAAFATLVRQYSEDPKTKAVDGDMRFLSEADLSSQFGPQVASAGVALKKSGEISEVVETDKGYHILRFQGRQAALNLGLDQVKSQIQNRILHERRTQNFNHFVDDLKAKGNYKLDEGALAKVEVDMKSPSAERKNPDPGFLPPPTTPGMAGKSRPISVSGPTPAPAPGAPAGQPTPPPTPPPAPGTPR